MYSTPSSLFGRIRSFSSETCHCILYRLMRITCRPPSRASDRPTDRTGIEAHPGNLPTPVAVERAFLFGVAQMPKDTHLARAHGSSVACVAGSGILSMAFSSSRARSRLFLGCHHHLPAILCKCSIRGCRRALECAIQPPLQLHQS